MIRTMNMALAGIICILCILLFCSHDAKAGKTLKSYRTTESLTIDGIAAEDIWAKATAVKTYDPVAKIEISIKSAHNDSTVFFLVNFPDKDESRKHRSWIWNDKRKMYEEGPDREDVFVLKWRLDDATDDLSIYSDKGYEADTWFWKANRTDPRGYADDKFQRLSNYPTKNSYEITSRSGSKMFLQRKGDSGRSAYKTNLYVDYKGSIIDRYTTRQPEASRADIRAKGVWKDGRWTIEFARALVTDDRDDINFTDLNKHYGFGVSRFEISGRPREDSSEQPLYGMGDTAEMLQLSFE